MLRLVLACLALCFSYNITLAKYCVKLPSCEELGYVFPYKEGRRQIRCPFDTDKALYLDYCQAYGIQDKPDEVAGEYQECIEEKADGTKINTGYYRYTRCNVGYFYESGKCLNIYYSYKIGDIYSHNGTPIGVVFDKNNETLEISIFALTNIDKEGKPNDSATMYWSTKTTSLLGGSSITDGISNTNNIIATAAAAGATAYAAIASRSYAPTVCTTDSECGVGKWYLPGSDEIQNIWQFLLKGHPEEMKINEECYWTSTEESINFAYRYCIYMTNAAYGAVNYYVNSEHIRPALKVSFADK